MEHVEHFWYGFLIVLINIVVAYAVQRKSKIEYMWVYATLYIALLIGVLINIMY